MNLDLLHSTCKDVTRKSFNEFKRQIKVRLFPFTFELKNNLQMQMIEQINQGVIKVMCKTSINDIQHNIIRDILNYYINIVIKTSNNYSSRYL